MKYRKDRLHLLSLYLTFLNLQVTSNLLLQNGSVCCVGLQIECLPFVGLVKVQGTCSVDINCLMCIADYQPL